MTNAPNPKIDVRIREPRKNARQTRRSIDPPFYILFIALLVLIFLYDILHTHKFIRVPWRKGHAGSGGHIGQKVKCHSERQAPELEGLGLCMVDIWIE
jgi:hypothetical protein